MKDVEYSSHEQEALKCMENIENNSKLQEDIQNLTKIAEHLYARHLAANHPHKTSISFVWFDIIKFLIEDLEVDAK